MRSLLILLVSFGVTQQVSAFAQYSCRKAQTAYNENNFKHLFGLEYTFTNQDIVNEGNRNPKDPGLANNPLKAKALKDFWNEIIAKCESIPGCQTEASQDKHGAALKVSFDDGFYMTLGMDSAALEVNAKPANPKDFKSYAHHLDQFAFAIAKKIGLYPHERAGQGHIHISAKAFQSDSFFQEDDGVLLRNFFVDFQNRPEIIYGALGNHLMNSPPLAAQKTEQRQALVKVLNDLDNRNSFSIDTFVGEIEAKVYTSSYNTDWGSFDYYQAFNMTRMRGWFVKQRTVEIRSFRPQQSTRQYQLQTRLLAAWIDRLKHETGLIPYINKGRYEYSAQEIVDGYYDLISYLGLPWGEYKELLLDKHMRIVPTRLK